MFSVSKARPAFPTGPTVFVFCLFIVVVVVVLGGGGGQQVSSSEHKICAGTGASLTI